MNHHVASTELKIIVGFPSKRLASVASGLTFRVACWPVAIVSVHAVNDNWKNILLLSGIVGAEELTSLQCAHRKANRDEPAIAAWSLVSLSRSL